MTISSPNHKMTILLRDSRNTNSVGGNEVLIFSFLIWVLILSQRFSIYIGGYPFSIGMFIFFAFFIFWLLTKKLRFDPNRLRLYLPALAGILVSAAISSYYSARFSMPSLLLLIGLYTPTVLIYKNQGVQQVVLTQFRSIMCIMSLFGIVQFITQLIGIPHRDWLSFIPGQFLASNYAYNIPVEYGANLYKSNGIFFLEPSHFSQFLALAIILEIYYFKRFIRLALLIPALLVTFSGTGIIALAIGLIPLLWERHWKVVLVFITITAIALYVFLISGYAYYAYSRVGEFQNPNTSGYIRFVGPIVSYIDFFDYKGETLPFWFGLGPGSSEYGYRTGWMTTNTAYQNTIMKLLFEYGFPSGLLFFAYLTYVFFVRKRLFWLSLVLFTLYTFLTVSLLIPQHVVLHYTFLLVYKD